jgi:BirA family transcriptional regulator, biotin operon repressor / biotin---[acetyl-CoA-carboxylase] ligase
LTLFPGFRFVSDCHRFDLQSIRRSGFVGDVESHEHLASTNDRGIELSRVEELKTPALIVAQRQSAGRGRGVNRWWSGAGGLTFSLVVEPDRDLVARSVPALTPDRWPRVALTAAVALHDVLHDLLPDERCDLKWPNDVLLAGKKVAGILVEVPPAVAEVPRRLVIGMGVNVNNSMHDAPEEIQALAVSLCDLAGRPQDPTALLVSWLDRFEIRLKSLAGGDPALPDRWRSLCVLTGRTVELKSGNRQLRGLCTGIAADGGLQIDSGNGPERIYAGVLVRVV